MCFLVSENGLLNRPLKRGCRLRVELFFCRKCFCQCELQFELAAQPDVVKSPSPQTFLDSGYIKQLKKEVFHCDPFVMLLLGSYEAVVQGNFKLRRDHCQTSREV